jgi:hypothetical protein
VLRLVVCWLWSSGRVAVVHCGCAEVRWCLVCGRVASCPGLGSCLVWCVCVSVVSFL